MRKILLFLFIIDFALLNIGTHAQDSSPSDEIPLLSKWELTFTIPGEFENPYNPAEVEVDVIFAPPNGEQIQVPAFYMQPYTDSGEPSSNPEWRVRFTPAQVGDWSYRIEVQDSEGTRNLDSGSFTVVPVDDVQGFIRMAPNGKYFTFQNGDPYFPLGENLAWSWEEGGGINQYITWLDDLQAAGATYARIFIDNPWFISLDWTDTAGDYTDSQFSAWQMDTILQAAEEHDIYLQVVMIWHQSFTYYSGIPVLPPEEPLRPDISADFNSHPYNSINGGPMSRPDSLYLDPEVKQLLQQRLRYIIARWGYSPHIFAWELVDSVDRLPDYNAAEHADFILQLADYVHQLDPYQHLITAGSQDALPELQTIPPFEFTTVHHYQRRPIEESGDQVSDILDTLGQTGVPVLMTEFSLNSWFEPTEDDSTGIHLRNTIWAATLSGSPGSAMTWWWHTYVAPLDLYDIYWPLSRFVDDIPWNTADFQPLEPGLVALTEESAYEYEPLRLDNFNRTLRDENASPPDTIYRLTPDGAIPSTELLSAFFYGSGFNAEASRPQTFILTPPIDTELTIAVRRIASGGEARLTVMLDGRHYTTLTLTSGNQNVILTIPLTAGEHTLVLDNSGKDWLELDYLEITDYRAPLRAMVLADRTEGIALAWIQHRDYVWQNEAIAEGEMPEPLIFRLDIPGMEAGIYRVEFMDTFTGNILGEDIISTEDDNSGTLSVMLLPVTSQLALRIFQVSEPVADSAISTFQPTPTPYPTRTPQLSPTPELTETP